MLTSLETLQSNSSSNHQNFILQQQQHQLKQEKKQKQQWDTLVTPSSPTTATAAHHTSPQTSNSHHTTKQLRKTKRTPSPPIRIPIQPGHCLVFGRKPDLSLVSNEITPKSTFVPIPLPKSFTHASRTHCLCTLIAPPLGGLNIRIVVKGQNGLMVDGERFEEGSSAGVELERRDGEQIELGFYGGKKVECFVKIDDPSTQRVRNRPIGQSTSLTPTASADRSTFNIKPKTRGRKRKSSFGLGGTSCSTRNNINPHRLDSNHHRIEPSPTLINSELQLSQTDQTHSIDLHANLDSPSSSSLPPKKSSSSPILPPAYDPNIHNLPPSERVRSVIKSMGLDLIGLIASAIVFSSRATVSTTEVVRAVLETQPSLAEAVLSLLPTPTSSRCSPRPTPLLDEIFGPDDSEIGLTLKKERECLSAPLPSLYPSPQDDALDTKPFASADIKPLSNLFGSEGNIGSPSLDQLQHPTENKADRVVNACRSVILETLQNHWRLDGTGMFGCVPNEGLKDASGEPLEALWYYQPQHDSDDERSLNLKPYVRHVRHTQTTSKQYFFKKVRGSGRRKI